MQGRLYYFLVRLKVREGLHTKGLSFAKVNHAMQGLDNDGIDGVGTQLPQPIQAWKFGDGTLITAITKFLESPAGKALIDALIQLLIKSIGGK